MRSLSVNQSLNLLYIHYREPDHKLGLTAANIGDLTLFIVSKYSELTSPYKERMIPQSKSELVDVLRSDKGAAGIFELLH